MSRVSTIFAIAILMVLTAFAPAKAAQQPTSPEQRARMIQLINALEKDPYHKDAQAMRREVFRWLADAPDVAVTLCSTLLVDYGKLKGDDGGILLGQLAYSEARFILEHPDRAGDAHAVHTAGAEGVLRTYAAMKRAKPKLKLDPIEKLARFESEGKLAEFVTSAMAKCK